MKAISKYSISYIFIGIALNLSVFNVVSGGNPKWINYTNGDNVTCLLEEGNYIWAGTTGGLVRINKHTKETIFYNKANSGLPDNTIRALVKDSKGIKWIGTEGGLARFDGQNWTVYNKKNSGTS